MREVLAELWKRQRQELIRSMLAGAAFGICELFALASLLLLLTRLGLPAKDMFPFGLGSHLPGWPTALVLFGIVVFIQSALSHVSAQKAFDIGLRFTQSLRRDLAAEFGAMPMPRLRRHNSSDISRMLTDDSARAGLAAQCAVGLSIQCLLCTVYFVAAFLISPAASVGTAVVVSTFVLISRNQRLPKLILQSRAALKRLNEDAFDFATGLQNARAHGLMDRMGQRLMNTSEQSLEIQRQHQAGSSRSNKYQQLAIVGLFMVLVAAIQSASGGGSSPLLPLAVLYLRLAPRIQSLRHQRMLLENSVASVAAIRAQLKGNREDLHEAQSHFGSNISVRDLRFEYEPGQAALTIVDVDIEAGAWVAIVGASGAGKSTFLRLLTGVEKPTTGQILVEGLPLQSGSIRQWQSQLSYVDQSPVFLHGSISENLFSQMTDEGRPVDTEVNEILRVCGLEPLIKSLPVGLETKLDGTSSCLSGGQRQRLAIARAIARKPKLLLLDEAANALDEAAENSLMLAVRAFLPGTTILSISHRVSSTQLAQRIIVVKGPERV